MNGATCLLVLAGLTSCAPRNAVPPSGDEPAEVSTAATPVVTLERTACFGRCPVYRISVSPSGEVFYEGRAHVRHLGEARGQVPAERVHALLSELERAGYFSFATRYAAAEPACGRYATDLPTAITTVRLNDRSKRIVHDYGCGDAPGALRVLERRIDEVLNSGQWTGE
ncbi:MAG TPA: DUF6438 domain-containing protein [Gemmatimonadales bacterium]|jgi:hypothetical protein|nr:DUF6438 domain-containing protein [Gemmatimonadales bacterium]